MQLEQHGHYDDESLERYAIGSLEEPALAELEEHLLLCSQCQGRLEEVDAYVAAMRGAAAASERHDESRRRFWTRVSSLFTFRGLGWVMTAAAVALVAMALRVSWSSAHPIETPALLLETSRGSDIPSAPAGQALHLSLDITGLPESAAYHVEIVDATGNHVSQSRAETLRARVHAYVPKGLRRGMHFVRLYSPSGVLLREYGLHVN